MFKPGDLVRRREFYRDQFQWPHGSKTFRVRECAGSDLWLCTADGNTIAWAARKFELALPQTFDDDGWE